MTDDVCEEYEYEDEEIHKVVSKESTKDIIDRTNLKVDGGHGHMAMNKGASSEQMYELASANQSVSRSSEQEAKRDSRRDISWNYNYINSLLPSCHLICLN